MTSPQPPSRDSTMIHPVMFGQDYAGPDGDVSTAGMDGVLLELLQDGKPAAQCLYSPEAAIKVGKALIQHAGHIQALQVNDQGERPSALDRVNAFNKAWNGASE